MWLSFIGFLLIFLDYKVPIVDGIPIFTMVTVPSNTGIIDFLPNFLGYLFLVLGSLSLGKENNRFRRLRIASLVMLILSLAEFVVNLTAFQIAYEIAFIIRVGITAGALYVAYEFSEGAKLIERSLYKKLGADKISSAWIILSLSSLLSFLVDFLPAITLPLYLLHWLSVIWFTFSVFQFSRKLKKANH